MQSDQNLAAWVIAWGAIAAVVIMRHWRRGRSVGLLLTYVLCFAALHWLVPLLQLLPWFPTPRGDLTAAGLYESTFAIAGFALGVELLHLIWSHRPVRSSAPSDPYEASKTIDVYLVVGLVLYGLSLAGVQLQLLTALVSTGSTLVAAAVGLKAWQAWKSGQYVRVAMWLASTLLFPLATVVIQGFLGYGFVAALIVLSLIATLAPTRPATVLGGALMLYLGLSVYVTYMRDRTDIRELVWGGEAVERRMAQIDSTLRSAELFDPWNVDHLAAHRSPAQSGPSDRRGGGLPGRRQCGVCQWPDHHRCGDGADSPGAVARQAGDRRQRRARLDLYRHSLHVWHERRRRPGDGAAHQFRVGGRVLRLRGPGNAGRARRPAIGPPSQWRKHPGVRTLVRARTQHSPDWWRTRGSHGDGWSICRGRGGRAASWRSVTSRRGRS